MIHSCSVYVMSILLFYHVPRCTPHLQRAPTASRPAAAATPVLSAGPCLLGVLKCSGFLDTSERPNGVDLRMFIGMQICVVPGS